MRQDAVLKMLRDLAQILIVHQTTPLTTQDIRNHVNQAAKSLPDPVTDDLLNSAVRNLEEQYQTVIGEDRTLIGEDDNWNPWLARRRAEINWRFYTRYEKHLRNGELPGPVIDRLDKSTDEVLDLLGNPAREGAWDRRGLVVGQVQSGKTGHYLGLVNKALDAGYKVVVIFTGFTESLRLQTQIRLDEAVTGGYNCPKEDNPRELQLVRVGVGKIDPKHPGDPETGTTRQRDFGKQMSNQIKAVGDRRQVFVMKKNVTLMKHLNNWIESFGDQRAADGTVRNFVKDAPLLVIDDESDVGSIDTKKGDFDDPDHDPSKVNAEIRTLLTLFERRTYVGYTATPFANVLIHDQASSDDYGDDLFPRSFIHALPAPSTHIGPGVVFGPVPADNLPIVRAIDLVENGNWVPAKHRKTHEPRTNDRDDLPPSLKQAMLCFILICAARRLRTGPDAMHHNSMLVHVTRFVHVQQRVQDQVDAELKRIRDALVNRVNDATVLADLKQLWNEDFVKTTATFRSRSEAIFHQPEHAWNEIERVLKESVCRIDVRGINGGAKDVLDYQDNPDGLHVIAIGGDKLSRGLTLEGLSVSYFLRSSRMYDTLMQMGRWFGYRPGYPDLCRLYLPSELRQWFATITQAAQELSEEFERMRNSRATPKEYGLRVRSHPDLLVTSQVKMRHGETRQVGFQGAGTQTIHFHTDRHNVTRNWEATLALLQDSTLHVPGKAPMENWSGYQRKDVEPTEIVTFLETYQGHSRTAARTDLLSDYIKQEVRADRLKSWTVALVNVEGGTKSKKHGIGDNRLRYVDRGWDREIETQAKRDDSLSQGKYQIRLLADPKYERIDLTPDEYQEALNSTQEEVRAWNQAHPNQLKKDPPPHASGQWIRNRRDSGRGLMVLYPIDPTDRTEDGADGPPLIGVQMSFPKVTGVQTLVTYRVNNVFQQEEQRMLDFDAPPGAPGV